MFYNSAKANHINCVRLVMAKLVVGNPMWPEDFIILGHVSLPTSNSQPPLIWMAGVELLNPPIKNCHTSKTREVDQSRGTGHNPNLVLLGSLAWQRAVMAPQRCR